MSDVVQQAKAALEGVTEGPWEAPETILGSRCTTVFGKDRQHVLYHAGTDANARFTAAARSLVPALMAEVEKLRGAIETIRAAAKTGDWLDILAAIERTEQP